VCEGNFARKGFKVVEEAKLVKDGCIGLQGEVQELKRKGAEMRKEHEGGVLEESEAFDPDEGRGVGEHSGRLEVLVKDSEFEVEGIRVERGLVQAVRPCVATVLCERVPFWLGGMRQSNWSSVRMEAWKPRNWWDHPEIIAAMQNLGEVIDEETTLESLMAGPQGSVVLISGTLGYVRKLLTWVMNLVNDPILIFVEGVGRRPVLPEGSDLVWRRISHKRVGGVTTQVGLFGFVRLDSWRLEAKVGHEIGHILNYGSRPQVAATGDPPYRHYKVGDWLQQAELELPVVHSTHWCGTGFGRRTLNAQELSSAFDLPLWMQPRDEASSTAWRVRSVWTNESIAAV
jgi:hypothetical protein